MLTIRLDQFLKLSGVVESGGQAKVLIQAGEVQVNGETETRRRRQLVVGDCVELGDISLVVEQEETDDVLDHPPDSD